MTMKKKLLVTDLDGTFVKNSQEVAKKDREFLTQIKSDMHLGIATGRSVKEIEYIEQQIQTTVDIKIGFNGGLIEIAGKKAFEAFIDRENLADLLFYIQSNDLVYDALDGKRRIGTYVTEDKGRVWNVHLTKPQDMFAEILPLKIYKINIRPETGRCDNILAQLQNHFPNLSFCKSGPRRIEITPSAITKGSAIEFICKKEPLEVITVGDSENDISMFQAAKKSFCLSHASQEVQAQADIIIDNFYEVGQFID